MPAEVFFSFFRFIIVVVVYNNQSGVQLSVWFKKKTSLLFNYHFDNSTTSMVIQLTIW